MRDTKKASSRDETRGTLRKAGIGASANVKQAAEVAGMKVPVGGRGGGTKVIAGRFPPAVSRQLRLLAIEQDTTVQNLLGEALNDLFGKYKKPRIA